MDQPRKVAKLARGQLNKEVVLEQCRCIRGKYIYMYLHSTVLLFVFVYIPGIFLFGDMKKKKCPTSGERLNR